MYSEFHGFRWVVFLWIARPVLWILNLQGKIDSLIFRFQMWWEFKKLFWEAERLRKELGEPPSTQLDKHKKMRDLYDFLEGKIAFEEIEKRARARMIHIVP